MSNQNMNKILNTFFAISFFAVLFFVNSTSAYAASQLEGGDFAQAFNNTTQVGTWRDPITAVPGDVVEFRVVAKNVGDQPTGNVQIWGSVNGVVPQDPSLSLVMTSRINDPNMSNVIEDGVTTNITGSTPVGMRYYPGHARINGRSSTYNCVNSCDIGDAGVLGGLAVGVIQPGDFIELTFKASLSALASSPTPSPSPSVAPSTPPASTPPAPTQTQTQTQTVNVTQNNNAPAVAGVKTLPKTGLPLAALIGLGALPAGLALKKFRKSPASEDAPDSIWEDRQIKLDS